MVNQTQKTAIYLLLLGIFLFIAMSGFFATDPETQQRPNVLFLAIDDLRPELGAYGKSHMQTPAIDRLAATGATFTRAYANVPVCDASRASMLTGLRPTRARFLNYDSRADTDAPGTPTIAAWFKRAGYTTISLGKVIHHRDDSTDAWSKPPWRPGNSSLRGYYGWRNYLVEGNIREDMKSNGSPAAFEAPDVSDDAYFDGKVAMRAIKELQKFAEKDNPFFLAVGFVKPHLPFNAPKRYWEMYPAASLPARISQPFPEGAPPQAWHSWGELRHYGGVPKGDAPVPEALARTLVQGYRAATSYTDAQVGRVLDELDRLDLAKNTIVVLWGDHGYSLGEHGLWVKHSPFELAKHVPLIVRAPGMAPGISDGLVESVDIYPTLVELAGLPSPAHLQGRSFAKALRDANAPLKDAVFTRWQNSESIRTERLHYTEWFNQDGTIIGRMLYDHTVDPGENDNLSEDPAHSHVVSDLSARLAKHINGTSS
jgi:arylsulfatase A-like enzyme